MMDAVSEKLVLATGGGAPPTAPSIDTAESARTQPGDDGVPTSVLLHCTHCSAYILNKKFVMLQKQELTRMWRPATATEAFSMHLSIRVNH